MYCEKCGTDLGNDEVNFCSQCGNSIQSAIIRSLKADLYEKNPMSYKKYIIILIIAIIGVFLTFNFLKSTPEKTLKNLVNQINNGNIVEAIEEYTNAKYALNSSNYVYEMDEIKLHEEELVDDFRKSKEFIRVSNMETIFKGKHSCKINVLVESIDGQENEVIRFVKLEGKWLVDIRNSNKIF